MPDLYLVTQSPLPKKFEGGYSRFSLGTLGKLKLLAIEDRCFKDGLNQKLSEGSGVIVLPDVPDNAAAIQEAVIVSEFALSLLTLSGHPSFRLAASFSGGICTRATLLPERLSPTAVFVETMTGSAAAQWLRRCTLSAKNLQDHLHITARRYVRFARSQGDADGLLDLCIGLESLLDSKTEVSFRFGVSLAKVTGERGKACSEMADLLSVLYEIRSKLAHGDPSATKLIKKLEPQLPILCQLAKKILTIYVLYTSEHSRAEWHAHLREALFA